MTYWASQVALMVNNAPTNSGEAGSVPESGRSPGVVFLPGIFQGQRNLAGYTVHEATKNQT